MKFNLKKYTIPILILATLMVASGCNKKKIQETAIVIIKPVKIQTIKSQPFTSTRKITGTAYAIQDVLISAQANGNVDRISVNMGDMVASGSVLAIVDQEMARAQLMSASSNYQLAYTNYQMQEQLYTKKLTSEQQYKTVKTQMTMALSQLELAKLQYKNTFIKSPIRGIISDLLVKQGEFINAGKAIFRVVDISQIKIKAGIAEEDLGSIPKHTRVDVYFPTISPDPFIGIVSAISPIADQNSKTFTAEIIVPNYGQKIKAGMLCTVRIVKSRFNQVAVIPQDSILEERTKSVFVVAGNIAHKKSVEVLGVEGDLAAVSGISDGEKIVISGQKSLNTNDSVKIVE